MGNYSIPNQHSIIFAPSLPISEMSLIFNESIKEQKIGLGAEICHRAHHNTRIATEKVLHVSLTFCNKAS
jgi:hypothetical protein